MTTAAIAHRQHDGETCEHERIERVALAGRGRAYLQFDFLELPKSLELPTCVRCGEVFARSDQDADAIDQALDEAWRNAVTTQGKLQLDVLVQGGIRQRDVERILDLSPGYLSKIKTFKEPSSSLVAVLALLAKDPHSRMKELDEVWNPAPARVSTVVIHVTQGVAPVLQLFPIISSGSTVTPTKAA